VARPGSESLTDRESQLMDVLWSHGDATAEQIRELLPDRPHDSTVRTVLRILESKGYVTRQGRGRPLTYRAVVSRSKAQRAALMRLLGRLFGGSPEALALRLLEDRHLTPEQFAAIARSAASSQGESPAKRSSAEEEGESPSANEEGGQR
jgi:BlaI family transcriptional regulator, penicillinase repressor